VKFKFELPSNFESDLERELIRIGNIALAKTAEDLKRFLLDKAEGVLNKGLNFWKEGFSLSRISGTNDYLIVIQGQMAMMMEDGFSGNELKKLILGGNRGKHNKSNGKDYVDVPFAVNSNEKSGASGLRMSFSDVVDADSMIGKLKNTKVEISDLKNRGTKIERRVNARIKNKITAEDFIISAKANNSSGIKTSILNIRRISQRSSIKGYHGAKIFDSDIESFLSTRFEYNLNN